MYSCARLPLAIECIRTSRLRTSSQRFTPSGLQCYLLAPSILHIKKILARVVNGIALNILNLLSLAEDSGSTWLPAMAQETSKWQHLQQDPSDLLLSPMVSLCRQKPHAQISALKTRDKTKTGSKRDVDTSLASDWEARSPTSLACRCWEQLGYRCVPIEVLRQLTRADIVHNTQTLL